MRNEAIGTWEAACLLGVHWTRPKKMAEAGILSIRTICGSQGREVAVYSAKECEENFAEYQSLMKRRNQGRGRSRTALDRRPDALAALAAKGRARIDFDDAIGVDEAAETLGVFWTRVTRLVEEKKIVGRILWSERSSRSRLWIFSKKSCVEWAREVRRQEASGSKKGRPRNATVAR